ncbi:MAG: hypothetical protein Q4F88_04650 [Eubacteriales bacterium]|nr:hypothetical protein [Eubacteriales bacterium]
MKYSFRLVIIPIVMVFLIFSLQKIDTFALPTTEELLADEIRKQEQEDLARIRREEESKRQAELANANYQPGTVDLSQAQVDYSPDLNDVPQGWHEDQFTGNWYYILSTGMPASDYMLYYGGDRYYFNSNGVRVSDEIIDYNGEKYYFDTNGVMVKNKWITLYEINEETNDVVLTHYYFGANGRAYRAATGYGMSIKKIDDERYGFDDEARALYGFVDADGKSVDIQSEYGYETFEYYFGDMNEPMLHTGWVDYDGIKNDDIYSNNFLIFYFSEDSGRKVKAPNSTERKTVVINGAKYIFDEYGVMRSEWYQDPTDPSKKRYFNNEYDGWLVEGWFTAVPPKESIQKENIDFYNSDDEQWFYADKKGYIYRNVVKKINGKYYCFDQDGVMQRNKIVVVDGNMQVQINASTGQNKLAEPSAITKGMIFAYGDPNDLLALSDGDKLMFFDDPDGDSLSEMGAMRYGKDIVLTMSGDDYTFRADTRGGFSSSDPKDTILHSGKVYQNGVLLKATQDNKYSIVQESKPTYPPYTYRVVDYKGSLITKRNVAVKDGNKNYLAIDSNGEYMGSFSTEIKYSNGLWLYKDAEKNWKSCDATLGLNDPVLTSYYAKNVSLYLNFNTYQGDAPSDK